MADQSKPIQEGVAPPEKRIPVGQIIFDDMFLLLMLGLLVPILFYLVWGLWSTSAIPVFQAEAVEAEHAMEAGDEHAEEEMEHVEPPDEYANLTNPFAGDPDAMAAGEKIYLANCAMCHGDSGHGDGPAGATLDPKPANLADAEMMSMLSDGYLFWRVSEGGMSAPFSSAMPPWKAILSEEQRWQVISFERALGQ